MMKIVFLKSWTTSLIGMILLLPASYFMLTLFVRIVFGSTTLYYAIAPSFLEEGSDLFPLHKSGWILYGPLLAVILNAASILQFRFRKTTMKFQVKVFYNKYWLNTAIAFQSILLFILLVIYLVIQHYRY
jgi:hypothetical protein